VTSGLVTLVLLLSSPEWTARAGPPEGTASRKISPVLLRRIVQGRSGPPMAVWIFFRDKGVSGPGEYRRRIESLKRAIPERAILRRRKAMGEDVFRMEDLPVYGPYVRAVSETGARIRVISRWFNGVSVEADASQILKLAGYPFVRSIEPVAKLRRPPPPEPPPERRRLEKGIGGAYPIDYGLSLDQLEAIGVPDMHRLGLDGSGVRVCMLDAGFSYEGRDIFSHLKVVAKRDFVDKDSDPSPGIHGTKVLSVIAGFEEGGLVGPAYNAEYLLARTEDVSKEAPIEEDYWIAGVEWADSLGADIISSSIGYSTWDEGEGESYGCSDLDGDTARITIAADMAVQRGILVVNAAGNEGNTSWRYILFPADGDSVIAVGAWDLKSGSVAAFSSRGPTADGRIKPDFVAPGVDVAVTGTGKEEDVVFGNGTSYAAPLLAGAAALLLQSHPNWTPMQLREALRISATNALEPDNDAGWGLIDIPKADRADNAIYGQVVDAGSGDPISTAEVAISSKTFSDSMHVSPSGRFLFRDLPPGSYSLRVEAPRYRRYLSTGWAEIPAPPEGRLVEMEAVLIPAGIYIYPNPYRIGSGGMKIYFPGDLYGEAQIRIFTLSGELVASIARRAGEAEVSWEGVNSEGRRLGSGVYIYIIEGDNFRSSGKLAIIR